MAGILEERKDQNSLQKIGAEACEFQMSLRKDSHCSFILLSEFDRVAQLTYQFPRLLWTSEG